MGGVAAAGALAALPRCKKDSGGGGVKVGLVIPQSGVYAPLGVDMKRAWDLYLEKHGGKLGKYEVVTVVGDQRGHDRLAELAAVLLEVEVPCPLHVDAERRVDPGLRYDEADLHPATALFLLAPR